MLQSDSWRTRSGRSQQVICFSLIALGGILRLEAQNVTGSTTVDLDQATNTFVVTCETDIDDGDYKPSVQCNLYDSSGNRVASQSYTPSYNAPYAEVVLTYVGQTGVTYAAIGTHIAICNIMDLPQGSAPRLYDDPYNFEYFGLGGPTYIDNFFDWFGPGPDTASRTQAIKIANTIVASRLGIRCSCSLSTGAMRGLGCAYKCGACSDGKPRYSGTICKLSDAYANKLCPASTVQVFDPGALTNGVVISPTGFCNPVLQ